MSQFDLPQGDVSLIDHPVAQALLHSAELARVAYVAADGTPRVFPMLFHWNSSDLGFSTFGGAKVEAVRRRPHIAGPIDSASVTPHVLLRGVTQSSLRRASDRASRDRVTNDTNDA